MLSYCVFLCLKRIRTGKKRFRQREQHIFPIARSYCERREETWLLFTLQQNRRENYVSIFTNSKRDRKRNSGFARKSDRRGGSGRRGGDSRAGRHMGRAQVPSGASTGKFEALEKRDQEVRYLGQGVRKAVEAVNTVLADAVVGENALEQERIDHILCQADGPKRKKKPRGKRHSRCLTCCGARGGKCASSAAVPVPGRLPHKPYARADDEYFKRRPSCRQHRRSAGIYDYAVRALPHSGRVFPCARRFTIR